MNFLLQTDRLSLRPLTQNDLHLLWPHVADSEISYWMTWDVHESKEVTKTFLQGVEKEFLEERAVCWAMFYQEQFAGLISLNDITRMFASVRLDSAELGYWLVKDFWNQGFMTEAAKEVLRFGFEEVKLHKITVAHFSENKPSEKVIKKLGFRFIGEQKQHFLKHGKWHDHKLYELLAEDFLK